MEWKNNKTIVCLLSMIGLAITIFHQNSWAQSFEPIGDPPPPTVPMAGVEPLPMTKVQQSDLFGRLQQEGKVVYLSGPETKGKPIQIANKVVHLPPDSYVEKYIVSMDCVPNMSCPSELPLLVIARGNSRFWVAKQSGKAFKSEFAPGEERHFDFLKGVIQP